MGKECRGLGRQGHDHRALGDDGAAAHAGRSRRTRTAFPPEVLEAFTRDTGLGWLGNYAASGTEIIQELGDEHVATGKPIVYTSADCVFQIAAHEDVIPIERALRDLRDRPRHAVWSASTRWGASSRGRSSGPMRAARTCARTAGATSRSSRPSRRCSTVLDEAGIPSYGIGKIGEIFAWRGVCESPHSTDNMDGFDNLVERVAGDDPGFVFANLVDFDMVWGHRNDVEGYARGLEAVDARIPELLGRDDRRRPARSSRPTTDATRRRRRPTTAASTRR